MARLLSVNVGLPRDIAWKGRTVHTGIWKNPVRGRCRVGRLNLDGDGQGDLAGHGGEQRAVFVYQIESYRYWQEQLKQDRLRPRTVRRELHDRRIARRRRVHRRPLSDRQRAVRGHATSRHLLSRRHPDERAADAGVADLQRTTGVLLPRPAGRRGGRRRRDREGGRGERANDRRGDQCAALFARSSAAIGWSARCGSRRFRPDGAASFEALLREPDDAARRVATPGSRRRQPRIRLQPGFRPLTVAAIDQESADVVSLTLQSIRTVSRCRRLCLASTSSCVFDRRPAGRRCFAATRSRVRSRRSAIGSA